MTLYTIKKACLGILERIRFIFCCCDCWGWGGASV